MAETPQTPLDALRVQVEHQLGQATPAAFPVEPETPPMTISYAAREDVADFLTPTVAERLHALRDDASAAHALTIDFMTLKESRDDLTRAQVRRDEMLKPRGEGGPGLEPGDARVTTQEAEVARLGTALD